MSELILPLFIGVALSGFFFGGLWWTIRKGMGAQTPALWFVLSFFVRMSVVLGGFYWIAQRGQWQHLAVALAGFIIVRMLLTRLSPAPVEVPHAP